MKNYKNFAIALAFKAGEIMKQNFTTGMQKEWKGDHTPLTKTDLVINDLVLTAVRQTYPDHGILAEEESFFHNEEYVWVCDPIDGTFPFSHGYPTFTFSLALVKNGKPILGILFDPILNRLVTAELSQGAFLDNKPIRVSETSSSLRARPLIAIEGGNEFSRLRAELVGYGCLVTTFACITYSAMLVALGEFAGAIWLGKTPWDGAAIQVIIEEAGGICTDIRGMPQRYDESVTGLIIGNKSVHDQLKHLVSAYLFDNKFTY